MSNTLNAVATAPTEEKTYANFADFNTFVCEARITHTEVKAGEYGEFVSVTAITTLKDGEQGIAINFRSNNGALTLAKNGHLMKGRRVHLTGKIGEIASHYVNKDGVIVQLQRPRLSLVGVTVMLGAKPKSATQADA